MTTKAEAAEKNWIRGHRAAWTSLLQRCLSELRCTASKETHAAWILERENAVRALRELCDEHGIDSDWDGEVNLGDIIEKYVCRELVRR